MSKPGGKKKEIQKFLWWNQKSGAVEVQSQATSLFFWFFSPIKPGGGGKNAILS